MKKCLFIIGFLVLALSSFMRTNMVYSQSLFNAPETVCVHQPVTLTSNDTTARNYYWGFCSGYLMNAPTGINEHDSFKFKIPTNIDIVEDSGFYYGFVTNSASREFLRLNFGTSLSNIPSVTNFGDLTNGLPINPSSLFILHDDFSHHWFIFVTGGFNVSTSSIARIDFGPHLNNPTPNIANFGNFGNVLDYPKGIFVAQDTDDNWWGYVLNHNTSTMVRLDFSYNVSNTPRMKDIGNPVDGTTGNPLLNFPTDMTAIKDNGYWYFFATNMGNTGSVVRLDMGTTLDTAIVMGNYMGNFAFRIDSPSSISMNKDCGDFYLYVTDSTTSQLVGISMPSPTGPYYAIDYSVVGGMNFPGGISSIIRDNDNVYGFICNDRDSTLTQVDFFQCSHSSIPSYTEVKPPVYTYDTPGVYNVYFVVNQGLPTMKVECKQITVVSYPPINMNTDTTMCPGDTIKLYAVSTLADSIRWTSTYNIDTVYLLRDSVRVFPGYDYSYKVTLYYPFGCIVDTTVKVKVSRVHADAGPDRWMLDGAFSTLGGPYTSISHTGEFYTFPHGDSGYIYNWQPNLYISDTFTSNPVVNPPADMTYYLTVTEINDTFRCKSMDTVNVHVNCGDLYLPNAFSPNSTNVMTNTFGVLNRDIQKLNFLRIYDRWGTMVFESGILAQRWDGTYNGKPCEEGVYVFIADAFCASGKEVKKTGNVTLMR